MKFAIRACCAAAVFTSLAMAQPVVNPGGILNAASYALDGLPHSGIAQGSMFIVFGRNLGPAALQQVTAFPLPTSQGLAGTSVRVTVGGTAVDAIMVYTVAGQVAAILPSNTPVGIGSLTVTYQGQTSAAVPIRVVRSALGVFTRNQAGSGPAIVQNVNSELDRPVNALTEVARPGQVMILWGTGLGPVSGNEAGGPLPGDLNIPVDVFVGGRSARILYRGRSGCCAGIDQIVFEVPEGVSGCYVPLAVRAGGVVSNFTSMSIAASGRFCSDPAGFSAADLERIAAGGNLAIGVISLSRQRTSITVPVLGSLDSTTDFGGAGFARYNQAQLVASQGTAGAGGFGASTFGACTVYTFAMREIATPVDPIQPQFLEAGPALTVTGPRGAKQLARQSAGVYSGQLGGGAPAIPGLPGGGEPEYLVPGPYTVSGPGGADVGAFQAAITLPPNLTWTNQAAISDIPRGQDLSITWSGGDAARQYVNIMGTSTANSARVTGMFFCTERVAAGRFTVPSIVLSALPASEQVQGVGTGTLSVGTGLLVENSRFNAPGLNIGFISHSENHLKTVNYR